MTDDENTAENGEEGKPPEERYKERVKEKTKREIEKEKTHEEALEEKEELEEEAKAEAELEHMKEEGVAKSILSRGFGAIGSGLSAVGSKVKGYAEGGIEGGESRKKMPEPPKGKNLSSLTELQKQYFRETGKWPKIEGTMTQDYYEWKQSRKHTGGRTKPTRSGGGGMFFDAPISSGGEPTGRNPLSTQVDRSPRESPLTQKGRSKEPVTLFESGKGRRSKPSNIFTEEIDQTDKNPFKLSKGESRGKNPFD